jgi:hypothetical protein
MVITSRLVRGEHEPLNDKPEAAQSEQHVTQDDPAVPDGSTKENSK